MPSSEVPNSCIAKVAQGTLEGRISGGVKTFLGIPYARAPLGPLRFRPPQPPASWPGRRPAISFAPASLQPPDTGLYPGDPDAMPVVGMSEDCLYLNVWAPDAEGTFPVLVWLHGGGQIVGGTARPVYNGKAFARRGIVCVTVGFRLGLLGTLELGELLGPSRAMSGNNRLADQIAALTWVRDNIACFGGDARRVTLGGESAGAKDVAALMASPLAMGLFSAAIMQSGGGETTHSVDTARAVARDFIAFTGIEPHDLVTMPASEILAAQDGFLANCGRRFPFRLVHGFPSLPEQPVDGVRQGCGVATALLIGTAKDEVLPGAAAGLFQNGWHSGLLAHRTPADMIDVEVQAAKLMPTLSEIERRRQLLIAEEYWLPSIRFADAHAASGGRTWMYRFDLPLPSGPLAGSAPHTAELSPTWACNCAYDTIGGHPASRMHDLVAEFVETHLADWSPYELPKRKTALMAETLIVTENPGRVMLELFSG